MSYLKRHMSKNCNLSFTTNRVYVFFTDFFKKYIFKKYKFFLKNTIEKGVMQFCNYAK